MKYVTKNTLNQESADDCSCTSKWKRLREVTRTTDGNFYWNGEGRKFPAYRTILKLAFFLAQVDHVRSVNFFLANIFFILD